MKNIYLNIIIAILIILIFITGIFLLFKKIDNIYSNKKKIENVETKKPDTKLQDQIKEDNVIPDKEKQVFDYNNLNKDNSNFDEEMEDRKARFGLTDSVDMIVKTDEVIKIGDVKIDIDELENAIKIRHGDLVEKDINEKSNNYNSNKQSPDSNNNKPKNQKDQKKVFIKNIYDMLFDKEKDKKTKNEIISKKISRPQKPLNQTSDVQPSENKNKLNDLTQSETNDLENQEDIFEENINEEDKINESGDISVNKNLSYNTDQNNKNNPEVINEPFDKEIEFDKQEKTQSIKKSKYLGIRVVKPGENIWDIHFNLLKDFYSNLGIPVSPYADEPDELGFSSGVGKILKFSENLVSIYNFQTKKFDINLNVIDPLSIIVVYNMNQIFDLLNQIDYSNINRIEFDGESLWLPGE